MKASDLLYAISKMMNDEYDEHAKLIAQIQSRTSNKDLLNDLALVHKTRIELLQKIYDLVKASK